MSQIRGAAITLASTTAGTGTGTSSVVIWQGAAMDAANFYLNVSTATGVTTADIYLQTSYNAGSTWQDFVHFTQVTTTTQVQVAQWSRKVTSPNSSGATITTGDAVLAAAKVVNGPICDNYFRVKWVIAATTSYGFQVVAIADRDI